MSCSQNERSLTWGARMDMKVNQSQQLLKAGTEHTGFLQPQITTASFPG